MVKPSASQLRGMTLVHDRRSSSRHRPGPRHDTVPGRGYLPPRASRSRHRNDPRAWRLRPASRQCNASTTRREYLQASPRRRPAPSRRPGARSSISFRATSTAASLAEGFARSTSLVAGDRSWSEITRSRVPPSPLPDDAPMRYTSRTCEVRIVSSAVAAFRAPATHLRPPTCPIPTARLSAARGPPATRGRTRSANRRTRTVPPSLRRCVAPFGRVPCSPSSRPAAVYGVTTPRLRVPGPTREGARTRIPLPSRSVRTPRWNVRAAPGPLERRCWSSVRAPRGVHVRPKPSRALDVGRRPRRRSGATLSVDRTRLFGASGTNRGRRGTLRSSRSTGQSAGWPSAGGWSRRLDAATRLPRSCPRRRSGRRADRGRRRRNGFVVRALPESWSRLRLLPAKPAHSDSSGPVRLLLSRHRALAAGRRIPGVRDRWHLLPQPTATPTPADRDPSP